MPEKCVKITMQDNWFQYGDEVITFGDTKLKYFERRLKLTNEVIINNKIIKKLEK